MHSSRVLSVVLIICTVHLHTCASTATSLAATSLQQFSEQPVNRDEQISRTSIRAFAAGVVPLDTDEGTTIATRCITPTGAAMLAKLQTQRTSSWCGLATLGTVFNTLRVTPAPEYLSQPWWRQDTLLDETKTATDVNPSIGALVFLDQYFSCLVMRHYSLCVINVHVTCAYMYVNFTCASMYVHCHIILAIVRVEHVSNCCKFERWFYLRHLTPPPPLAKCCLLSCLIFTPR
jgi:hypothetical protein